MTPWHLGADEISNLVRGGELSALEVWLGLERCFEADGEFRAAFTSIDRARVRARAEGIDRRRLRGEQLGALAGVPVAIKGNLSLEGESLRCGSRALQGYRASFTATSIERLLAADALVVGHTCLDEFAMGSSGEHTVDDVPTNPWHEQRVPGGSSSGSAVAVAKGLPLALGSDTGGSIRQPAAFCGVVGLRPSYGRVSRRGLVAFASSMDQIGPLSRDVRGAARALEVIAGHDPRDATSSRQQVEPLTTNLEQGAEGLRVGVPSELAAAPLEAAARREWQRGLGLLSSLGAQVVEVTVPSINLAVAAYSVLSHVEASSNLARFDGVRYGLRSAASEMRRLYTHSRLEGFGPEVTRRLVLGTFASSASSVEYHLERARELRRRLTSDLAGVLESVDLLATPTTVGGAFAFGERFDEPVAMYLTDAYTTPASLAGLPALAVPTGLDDQGLPLSMQLIGRPFDEMTILRAGYGLESAAAFAAVRQQRGLP